MKRTFLILLTVVSCLAVSFDAVAEERLIAVIMAASHPRYQEVQTFFEKNSDSFCGADCKMYVQTPNADTMSLRNSIRKAVALDADLIVTYGPAATMAAKLEQPPMSVLFADVYDPVKLGLVSEKTGVGHRMTGVRGDAPVQALFKYFVESTNATSLAVLFDSQSLVAKQQEHTLYETGSRRKVEVFSLPTTVDEDYTEALSKMLNGTGGVFIASSDHADPQLEKVISFASERKVPVITQRAGAAEQGAFMTLETSAQEQGERLAKMADKLLSGTDLGDLPLEKPREILFIVNLGAAKDFGINVPFTVLSHATSVIK